MSDERYNVDVHVAYVAHLMVCILTRPMNHAILYCTTSRQQTALYNCRKLAQNEVVTITSNKPDSNKSTLPSSSEALDNWLSAKQDKQICTKATKRSQF